MLLTANLFTDILTVIVVAMVSLVLYFKWRYKYWEKLGVPYIKPTIPFGTLSVVPPEAYASTILRLYKEAKTKGYRYVGLFGFTVPQLMIIDPVLVKNVLTKDFNHFMDRGMYHNEEIEPLSNHLFSLEGAKWKTLREKLTPTFTSGKMKIMFNTVLECGNQLINFVDENCSKGPMNIKQVLECFTINVIGSTAFGIDCNAFTNPTGDFCKYARKIFCVTPSETAKHTIAYFYPSVIKSLRIPVLSDECSEFFSTILKETVQHRQISGGRRNDFLQILIDLLHNDKVDEKHNKTSITLAELSAQSFLFFAAGYETSSNVMSHSLFELALNPDHQEKVRDEINAALRNHNDAMSYEAVNDMKYLNAVIDETMRMYPPVVGLNRVCTIDYKVPDSHFIIKKGLQIMIPSIALQNDPEYYSEPEKFDPTRFGEENKNTTRSLPYLPFGDGPRTCIGLRFGVMQAKIGLAILLKNFKFSISDKMILPLQISAKSFIFSAEGGVWLNVDRI